MTIGCIAKRISTTLAACLPVNRHPISSGLSSTDSLFGKVHASEEIIILSYRVMQDGVANGIGLTPGWPSPFVLSFNCSGFDTGDVFEDYRLCMKRKWETDSMPPKWSRRGAPSWRYVNVQK
jgi:hypothetical protein